MLNGLSRPTSGAATIAGLDIYRDTNRIKERIGYMSQRFSLYEDLTVRENIRFYGGIYGLSRARIKTKTANIIERLDLAVQADKVVAGLPLGWKQRLAFAVAGVHDPAIIFLDEPTGGVDPATRREFWEMIYEAAARGVTIFVTTHYMDEAEYCDRISIMVAGKIEALGTPRELKQQYGADNLDEVFLRLVRRKEIKNTN
jgi:ABC-2 type transport system ATP-binding protein